MKKRGYFFFTLAMCFSLVACSTGEGGGFGGGGFNPFGGNSQAPNNSSVFEPSPQTTAATQADASFPVSINIRGGGSVTPSVDNARVNDTVTFDILAIDGYYLSSFVVNGVDRTSAVNNGYFVTAMVDGGLSIQAVFTRYGTTSAQDNPPASSQGGTQSQVAHKHTWSLWEVISSPTCEQDGYEIRYCECGESQTRVVEALGHDIQIYVITPLTCESDGEEYHYCSRCDYSETIYLETPGHDWSILDYLYSPNDGYRHAYVQCCNCYKEGISVQAIDGTLGEDSYLKASVSSEFVKLNGNDQYITYVVNTTGLGARRCRVYMQAMMDNWNAASCRNATYYYNGTPSFSLTVNDETIDISDMRDVTYREMLSEEYGDYDNYSPLKYCPVGYCNLVDGTNTIVYTRLTSYTLTVLSFLFVFENIY